MIATDTRADNMALVVKDLRSKRLQALAAVDDNWGTDAWNILVPESMEIHDNQRASESYLNGSAVTYINQLETRIPDVLAGKSFTWTYDYWCKEAATLYKQITGEADVSNWSLWGVLKSTAVASAKEVEDKLPSKPELYAVLAVVVVGLVALAVIKVS